MEVSSYSAASVYDALMNPTTELTAPFSLPTAVQRLIATRETRLSHLEGCLFLPHDHNAQVSIAYSETIPHVLVVGDAVSLETMKAGLANAGIRALPSSEQILRLKDSLHSISTSFKSITISLSPGLFLPLWVASLLLDLHNIYTEQCQWHRALRWVKQTAVENTAIMELLHQELGKSFQSLCVSMPVQGLLISSSSASTFPINSVDPTCLLSDEWLSNFNIDPLIRLINRFAESETMSIRALTLAETTGLYDASIGTSPKAPGSLASLEHDIQRGHITRVLAPVFVHGNHFTLFSIEQTFSYADSLDASAHPPLLLLHALRGWAQRVVSGKLWVEAHKALTVPAQNDMSSCGVVVLSTIAAIILGLPCWSQQNANMFRIFWFTWSANSKFKKVKWLCQATR